MEDGRAGFTEEVKREAQASINPPLACENVLPKTNTAAASCRIYSLQEEQPFGVKTTEKCWCVGVQHCILGQVKPWNLTMQEIQNRKSKFNWVNFQYVSSFD